MKPARRGRLSAAVSELETVMHKRAKEEELVVVLRRVVDYIGKARIEGDAVELEMDDGAWASVVQPPEAPRRVRRPAMVLPSRQHSILLEHMGCEVEARMEPMRDNDARGVELLTRGAANVQAGDKEAALADLDEATSLEATSQSFKAEAWHRKGTLLATLSRVEDAVHAHRVALTFDAPAVHRSGLTSYVNLALRCSEDWLQFDAEALDHATQGRPVSAYAARVLSGPLVSPLELAAFTSVLDAGYGDNPYHNRLHGVDVMQASNLLSRQVFDVLDDVAHLAVVFAAMVHDFKHPGLNEKFLVDASHPIALRYSDDSVLERMHLAEAFELLAKHDWLRTAHRDVQRAVRAIVINCVLATDLKRSSHHITVFQGHCDQGSDFASNAPAQRSLCALVVKLADVSHPTRSRRAHLMWSSRIMLEFVEQGKRERACGQTISPLCDPTNLDLPKAQRGFIDFVCRPIFDAFFDFSRSRPASSTRRPAAGLNDQPTLHVAKLQLDDNYDFWGTPEASKAVSLDDWR